MGLTRKEKVTYDEVMECDMCGAVLNMNGILIRTWEELRRTGFDTTNKWYTFLINEGECTEKTVALCPKCLKAVVNDWWVRKQSDLPFINDKAEEATLAIVNDNMSSYDDIPF